ncbi:MAG TPA: TrmH family RNA methyltransferase [Gammaproteobacteria bacterium]|nr:TrmH family RNA methyltransferase [Gammaproteobacteria bacterium]
MINIPGTIYRAPLLIMKHNTQLTHADHRPSGIKFPLCILANDLNSPANVGSLFRICDALGIEKLYLCGSTIIPPNKKINKTSRSTEKVVDFEYSTDAEALVSKLKISDYFIITLEITSSSVAINSDEYDDAIANKKPVCLILGSESSGVDEKLLSLSDIVIHIPMHGKNSSMNVISATSIACFEIIKNLY